MKRRRYKPEPPSRQQLERLKDRFRRVEIGSHGPPAAEEQPKRKWKPSGRKSWRKNHHQQED